MEGYRDERPRRAVGARQRDVVRVNDDVRRAVVIDVGDRHAAGECDGDEAMEKLELLLNQLSEAAGVRCSIM